ncbi:MAG: hypothetical protein ACXWNH_18610 [Vulcanimicrobiaceae bacterium]
MRKVVLGASIVAAIMSAAVPVVAVADTAEVTSVVQTLTWYTPNMFFRRVTRGLDLILLQWSAPAS